ncbi:protein zwilch homolog [Petromyzon marinus]|uniref:protein zwilch homolog n=1 Tax=Petromyzon marinus TaxID=7757 RepID=UPI003F6F41A1
MAFEDAAVFCEFLRRVSEEQPQRATLFKDDVTVRLLVVSDDESHPLSLVGDAAGRAVLLAERRDAKEEQGDPAAGPPKFRGPGGPGGDDNNDTDASGLESPATGGPLPSPRRLSEQECPAAPDSFALPLSVARRLVSWYMLAQDPCGPPGRLREGAAGALPPLWVACDAADPEGTCWLGAVPILGAPGSKGRARVQAQGKGQRSAEGVTLYTATCQGPVPRRVALPALDKLCDAHKQRHHTSAVKTRAYVRYDVFGANVALDSTAPLAGPEAQSSLLLDFTWSRVAQLGQPPPADATGTLLLRVEPGDPRSPAFSLYRELDFLLALARGLRTGEMEWPEVLETRPASEIVGSLLEEMKSGQNFPQTPEVTEEESRGGSTSVDAIILASAVPKRSDLDFTEQLWVKVKSAISGYSDLVKCLRLVLQSLERGDIQPWTHRDSASQLSRVVQRSLESGGGIGGAAVVAVEPVPLAGLAPVQLLLEIGLEKLRRDYIHYFLGQELTTFNYLDHYVSGWGDVQDQVQRLHQLHHALELVATYRSVLHPPHEQLFFFTTMVLQYYRDHALDPVRCFHLAINPSTVRQLLHTEQPVVWRVVVASAQGAGEARSVWMMSTKPPGKHHADTALGTGEESEEPHCYVTHFWCTHVLFS